MDETPNAGQPQAPVVAEGGRTLKRVGVVLLFAFFLVSLAAGIALVRIGGEPGRLEKAVPLLGKSKRQAIGWINIRGAIYDSGENRAWGSTDIEQWSKRLRDFGEDSQVKAIVIEINSPGGSVGAVQELYAQILKVRADSKKPVIALMGDIAASGGYYLAAACDKIIAHPGTLTGSIGVIFHMTNYEGLMKKVGITAEPIKSGKMKDIGSPTRPMTAEERKLLQALIDEAYGQFLSAVAEGRKMPEEKVRPFADGRIFTGTQALEAGLVDSVGTSIDAIALAKKLGRIIGEPKILHRQDDVLDRLSNFLEEATMPAEARVRGFLLTLAPGPGLEYRWSP